MQKIFIEQKRLWAKHENPFKKRHRKQKFTAIFGPGAQTISLRRLYGAVMDCTMKEVFTLGRHSIMSEQLKAEIAKELGVDDKVKSEGWGAVSSRDCGNMVKKAIEIAQRNVEK